MMRRIRLAIGRALLWFTDVAVNERVRLSNEAWNAQCLVDVDAMTDDEVRAADPFSMAYFSVEASKRFWARRKALLASGAAS